MLIFSELSDVIPTSMSQFFTIPYCWLVLVFLSFPFAIYLGKRPRFQVDD